MGRTVERQVQGLGLKRLQLDLRRICSGHGTRAVAWAFHDKRFSTRYHEKVAVRCGAYRLIPRDHQGARQAVAVRVDDSSPQQLLGGSRHCEALQQDERHHDSEHRSILRPRKWLVTF